MNILIINSGPSADVTRMAAELKTRLGDKQVHVFNCVPTTDDGDLDINVIRRQLIDQIPSISRKHFDFVLISGGHSDVRLRSIIHCYKCNGLNESSFKDLMHCFEEKKATFGHVILSSCYSTFYQHYVIPCLHPETGSILSIPMFCTDKMMTLFSDLVEGRPPQLEYHTLQGFRTVLRELEEAGASSAEGAALLAESRALLLYDKISTELEKMEAIFKGMKESNVEEIFTRIFMIQERINGYRRSGLPGKLDILDGVDSFVMACLCEPSQIFSTEDGLLPFTRIREDFDAGYREELVLFMKSHHGQCESGGFDLLSAIESPFVFYHKGTYFVRTQHITALPKTVILACEENKEDGSPIGKEIGDNIRLFNFFIERLECGLVRMEAAPKAHDFTWVIQQNQYVIADGLLWYFDHTTGDIQRLAFLPKKSLPSLVDELSLSLGEKRNATEQELGLIRSYTGHIHKVRGIENIRAVGNVFDLADCYRQITSKRLAPVSVSGRDGFFSDEAGPVIEGKTPAPGSGAGAGGPT